MKYAKPPVTFSDQVTLLESRGLVVPDKKRAEHFLSHLNYYRFAGYVLPFEQDHASHQLRPGTTFDQVLDLYIFDRELRLLLLDAIERIEVSVRTQWAYYFAHATNAHGYLNPTHSSSARIYARNLATLERELERSSETFIKHFRQKYTDPDLPPIWAACEVMTMGLLSNWYSTLRPIAIRKKIANTYLLDQQVLESVLHHLSYIRNVCAHHSRLWNRSVVVTFSVPHRPKPLAASIPGKVDRRLYNTLCLIMHMLSCISPGHHWRERLQMLLDAHKPDTSAMGFPADWTTLPIWN